MAQAEATRTAIQEALFDYTKDDNDLRKAYNKSLTLASRNLDVPREMGFERLRKQRELNKQAYLKPKEWFEGRDDAYKEAEEKIQETYFDTYQKYIDSGFSPDDSKSKALSVANSVKNAEMEALNVLYNQKDANIAGTKAKRQIEANNHKIEVNGM